MADPPAGHGATQNGGDMILDQQVSEALGAVTASESDGHAMVMGGGKEKCLRLPEATPGIA